MKDPILYAKSVKSDDSASNLFPITKDSIPLTDSQILDYLMVSCEIERKTALSLINGLYEVLQFNLLAGGNFKLRDLLSVSLDLKPGREPKEIQVNGGGIRKYKGRDPSVRLSIKPENGLDIMLSDPGIVRSILEKA